MLCTFPIYWRRPVLCFYFQPSVLLQLNSKGVAVMTYLHSLLSRYPQRSCPLRQAKKEKKESKLQLTFLAHSVQPFHSAICDYERRGSRYSSTNDVYLFFLFSPLHIAYVLYLRAYSETITIGEHAHWKKESTNLEAKASGTKVIMNWNVGSWGPAELESGHLRNAGSHFQMSPFLTHIPEDSQLFGTGTGKCTLTFIEENVYLTAPNQFWLISGLKTG